MTHPKPSSPSCPDVRAIFQAELARAVPASGLPPAGPQLWPRFARYY